MRRGPTPAFGGGTINASPLTVSIFAMWSPASDAYHTSPFGVVVMPDAGGFETMQVWPRLDVRIATDHTALGDTR